MAAKTLYTTIGTVDGYYWLGIQDGGSPPPLGGTYRWTYGAQTPPRYARLATLNIVDEPGDVPVSTTSVEPDVETGIDENWISTSADAYRSDHPFAGSFAAGNWSIAFKLVSSDSPNIPNATVKVRLRVWKSANADGTSATELTSSTQVSSTLTLDSSTIKDATITWSAPALTFDDEYLFYQIGYELDSNAGSAGQRLIAYAGGVTTTTDFVPNASQAISHGATTATATSGTSLTLNVPSGTKPGDLLVVFLAFSPSLAFSTLAGWTVEASWGYDFGILTDTLGCVLHRVATSSEPASYTFPFTGGSASGTVGVMLAYGGVGAPTLNNLTVGTGASGTSSTAAFTPTTPYASALGDLALFAVVTSSGTGHAPTDLWRPTAGYVYQTSVRNATRSIGIVTQDTLGVPPAGTVLLDGTVHWAVTGWSYPLCFFPGVVGYGQVGTPAIQVDSSAVATGVHATGHVGDPDIQIISAPQPAFQSNAFQETAFQTTTKAYVAGVRATGNVGDVTIQVSVDAAATGLEATGAVGALDEYHVDYFFTDDISAVGELGTPDVPNDMDVYPDGLEATGYVGVVDSDVPAFQNSAFQLDAFQTILAVANVDVAVTGLEATGEVGTPDVPNDIYVFPDGLEATGILGTATASAVSDNSASVTGLEATGVVGAVNALAFIGAAVTGVHGTGHVGTCTFTWDMSFTLPRGLYELRAMRGDLGTIGLAMDSSPTADSVIATGYVGSVVYESSVSPDGLEASGVLGDIDFLIDSSPAPAGVFAFGGLGTVRFKVEYTIAGVQGTGAVGAPVAKVTPELVTAGLSVAGGGHVGAVGFIIDCNVHPTGLQSAALLHGFTLRVDSDVAVTGLEASGAVGGTVEENLYAVAGVHGTGQVGTTSPTHAIAVRGVTALGEVGAVAIHHDMTVFPAGIFGTGLIGSPEFPHLVVVDRDKMIYTRAPQPGH